MIRIMLGTEDRLTRRAPAKDEITHLLADPTSLLWLDVESPTSEDLRWLTETFAFHPLALEDAAKSHQRPKVERYEGFYFLVCYDIDYIEDGHRIEEHELDAFVGPNYLVTLHMEPIDEVIEVANRFGHNVTTLEKGVGVLLYTLLDTIVDHYFPVVERVGERIHELEARLLVQASAERGGIEDIFALKKELLNLRRTIAPQHELLTGLVRRDLPVIDDKLAVYFRDVAEHLRRVTDAIDFYRDVLKDTQDAYLSLNANHLATASNGLNGVMKTLTSYSIILMGVNLVASIYGMNFNADRSPWNMPELNSRYGYPGALVGMVFVGIFLAYFFKRKRYLLQISN